MVGHVFLVHRIGVRIPEGHPFIGDSMKKLILFLSMCLCSVPSYAQVRMGPDGYEFAHKQVERREFRAKVFTYRTHAALVIASKQWGINLGNNVNGFSITVNGVCQIHIHDPSYSYEPEIAGHEMFHCMYGKWHEKR